MWVRFGRWVELGVHFGRQHSRMDALDRYLVHASVRCGNREWNYGPGLATRTVSAPLDDLRSSPIDRYPDPEPLRWGVRKVLSASSSPAEECRRPTIP